MSTSQKRDADMDRLLRAVLKPAPRETAVECPDAGVLAAFVEGGLTATEQSSLDAHIVSCGRCQEALAVLSQGLPPQEEAAIATPETGWFTWVTRPRLRWLVPISAAATVAAVFFASRPLIAPEGEVVPASEVTRMAQAPAPPAGWPGAATGAGPREVGGDSGEERVRRPARASGDRNGTGREAAVPEGGVRCAG